jgi:DHA1 family bicyclomycin/chloramphenicol resistance-like MFS transporter
VAVRRVVPGSKAWIGILAALNAIVALGVDMSLPAQPTLVATFGTSKETAALTLSLFLGGFAIGQLLVGYVSDALGRRRVLLTGLAVFALAGTACALATSIEMLIVCRIVQGLAASAAPVIVRAMIRDTQPADSAARLLSAMLAILALAPMIAPTIGGVLLHIVGWYGIFAVLAGTGAILLVISWLYLDETLVTPQPANLAGMLSGFRTFFRTRGTKLPMLISCCSFAGQFAYIAASPYILMEGYGVSESHYGYYFALTALALMLGAFAGRAMLRAGRAPSGMIVVGTSLLLTGGVLVALSTHLADFGIAGFIVPMMIYFFGSGMSGPSASAIAMDPVPQIAGTASSVIGFCITSAGSISGWATTKIGGASPTTFSMVVGVMGAFAWVIALTVRSSKNRDSRTSDTDSAHARAA